MEEVCIKNGFEKKLVVNGVIETSKDSQTQNLIHQSIRNDRIDDGGC